MTPRWSGEGDDGVAASMCCRDRGDDAAAVVADGFPVARGKLDDRYLAASQVLLIPDIAVGGDEDLETASFGCGQQIAVGQPVPAHMMGGFNLMS